ncbi:hypothetical protein PG994_004196 [Apiospora phragmitis]|uniref:Carboxylic ester hydrolase n=1 Tax=Apiospora phragmitis TaxID=2905665 RepID=A0ABR1VR23_9PEZI
MPAYSLIRVAYAAVAAGCLLVDHVAGAPPGPSPPPIPGPATPGPSGPPAGPTPPRGDGHPGTPVRLANGTYRGVHNEHYQQDFFLGMPYAQPPVGTLRFAPPQPLNTKFPDRDASAYGPMCIGYGSDTVNNGNVVSEDCVKEGDNLPVTVWIHGGSYIMGGSSDPRYNLTYMVDQSVKAGTPIVAASINYRLNNWGFMYSAELAAAGAGNLGLRDQRQALRWVSENIGAFGGSKDKVTLWGESAGARSVGMQLVAYDGRSDGLFHGAMMESGSPVAIFDTADNWQPYFDALVQQTGCASASDRVGCLRDLPWETLNALFNSSAPAAGAINGVMTPPLSAVIDGDFITGQGANLLREGKFAKVPLLLGNNFDEGTAYAMKGIDTDAAFTSFVASSTQKGDAVVSDIARLYPDDPLLGIPAFIMGRLAAVPWGLQFKRSAAFAGDFQQHSGRRMLAQTYAAAGQPVYSYLWNLHVNGIPIEVGATHFQEVAFVFNNVEGKGYSASPFANRPETYVQLADMMSRMWVAFVAGADPNAWNKKNIWPLYAGTDPEDLVFDVNATDLHYTTKDDYRKEGIAYIIDNVYN